MEMYRNRKGMLEESRSYCFGPCAVVVVVVVVVQVGGLLVELGVASVGVVVPVAMIQLLYIPVASREQNWYEASCKANNG